VIYSFFAGTLIYKEINLKKLSAALIKSAEQTGTIMVVAAAATFFARMLTIEQFQVIIKQFALGMTDSRIVILLVLNIILLILGCLMDTTPIILVFAPILLPIAAAYGVNAVHFGVMMCINLAIGLITPPVGISLFVAAGQTKEPFGRIVKNVWPALVMLLIGLIIITYVPAIVTFLPTLFGVM
jgi:C4-dicarboxylate transporter DctM subunit